MKHLSWNCQPRDKHKKALTIGPLPTTPPNPGVQGVASNSKAGQPETPDPPKTPDPPELRRERRMTRLPAKLNDYILEYLLTVQ